MMKRIKTKTKKKEGKASNSDIEKRPHFLSSIFDCVWESDGGVPNNNTDGGQTFTGNQRPSITVSKRAIRRPRQIKI